MSVVRIPPTLRAETNGERQVEARGGNVRELLDDLTSRFPGLRRQIIEDDAIAPFVNVYVEGEDVRTLDGLETPVREGATVILLPAMAGGVLTSVRELYELWAGDRLSTSELARSLEPRGTDWLFELFASLGPKPGELVVDVGARDARHAIRLVREHDLRAVALDPLPRHVELAQEAVAASGLDDRGRRGADRGDAAAGRGRRLDLVPRRARPRRRRARARRVRARAPARRLDGRLRRRSRPTCSSRARRPSSPTRSR